MLVVEIRSRLLIGLVQNGNFISFCSVVFCLNVYQKSTETFSFLQIGFNEISIYYYFNYFIVFTQNLKNHKNARILLESQLFCIYIFITELLLLLLLLHLHIQFPDKTDCAAAPLTKLASLYTKRYRSVSLVCILFLLNVYNFLVSVICICKTDT